MLPTEAQTGRLFFALWPDADTRDSLCQAQRRLAVEGVRELHAQDLHLTLAFIGSKPTDAVACIEQAGDRVDVPSLQLCLDRQGSWDRARVSWLGVQPNTDLTVLVDQLWDGLASCGLQRESRPYCPHVTLHRKVRGIPDGPLTPVIQWRASDFVLAESSRAAGAVPRYRVRRRWRLADAR